GETVIKLGTEHLSYIIPCVDNFHIIGCFALTKQWKLLLYMMMMTEFIINAPTLLAQNIGITNSVIHAKWVVVAKNDDSY
ncbi:4643_t:CDS:2, partial [Funneliformis mosseae]